MKKVKVIFKDSQYNYSTSVNGNCSDQEIRKYFVGKFFNLGNDSNENMQQCINIEIS